MRRPQNTLLAPLRMGVGAYFSERSNVDKNMFIREASIFGITSVVSAVQRLSEMVTGDSTMDRRTAIKATGALMASTALAGCSGESDTEASFPESFGGWMDNVGNYDSVTDMTGEDEITIDVAIEGNEGNYAYGPAAVGVSSGTKVVWKWTGEGGSHNVVASDGSFESELVGEEGHTFERTFDSSGTYKYKCVPHETFGMKGVVVVV